MLFQLLADSFLATAILLCVLHYTSFALGVYSHKLNRRQDGLLVEVADYRPHPGP